MGDTIGRAAARIEVGVEHALRIAELELEAVAFPNLERGRSEPSDEVVRSHPDQGTALFHGPFGWSSRGGHGSRARRAACEENERRNDKKFAHGHCMPRRRALRKLLAATLPATAPQ